MLELNVEEVSDISHIFERRIIRAAAATPQLPEDRLRDDSALLRIYVAYCASKVWRMKIKRVVPKCCNR